MIDHCGDTRRYVEMGGSEGRRIAHLRSEVNHLQLCITFCNFELAKRSVRIFKFFFRLLQLHICFQGEAEACIPVYVVLEEDVRVKGHWILKSIVKKGSIIVVITEDTLRGLGKLKRTEGGDLGGAIW